MPSLSRARLRLVRWRPELEAHPRAASRPDAHHTAPPPVHGRRIGIGLLAVPAAAGLARHFTSCTIRAWDMIDLVEPAELLVSELFTNAVKATALARPPGGGSDPPLITVGLRSAVDLLLIEVGDGYPDPPILHRPDDDAEGGRGLMLVDVLSIRWGYFHPRDSGKVVWCLLKRTP